MVFLTGQLDIARELDVVEPAHRLYNLALNKNFTRGRRTNQVPVPAMICATGSGVTFRVRGLGPKPKHCSLSYPHRSACEGMRPCQGCIKSALI